MSDSSFEIAGTFEIAQEVFNDIKKQIGLRFTTELKVLSRYVQFQRSKTCNLLQISRKRSRNTTALLRINKYANLNISFKN